MSDSTGDAPLADTKSTKRGKTAPENTDAPDEQLPPEEVGDTSSVDDTSAELSATATSADTSSTAPIESKWTDAHAAGDDTDSALTEGVADPSIKSTDGTPATDETQPNEAAVSSAPDPSSAPSADSSTAGSTGVTEGADGSGDAVDSTESTDPSFESSSTADGGVDGTPATSSEAGYVPGQVYGSGEPIADPGSPVTGADDPATIADSIGAAPSVEATDDDLPEEETGALSAQPYYGADDDLPDAPDPEADGAVAGQPTSTMPQAADSAVIRQSPSGIPANAYIPPGFRFGGVPIVDTPDSDDLRGGAGTAIVGRHNQGDDPAYGPSDGTEPLGEEKRFARVSELEDEKRDQVNASTLDPDAGDTAAPQGDIDDPQPVGTPYDVVTVTRVTSYPELVAELGLTISFIELAAFNQVVNQRYELFPGDKVRIPEPNTPARLDGVDYGDDE